MIDRETRKRGKERTTELSLRSSFDHPILDPPRSSFSSSFSSSSSYFSSSSFSSSSFSLFFSSFFCFFSLSVHATWIRKNSCGIRSLTSSNLSSRTPSSYVDSIRSSASLWSSSAEDLLLTPSSITIRSTIDRLNGWSTRVIFQTYIIYSCIYIFVCMCVCMYIFHKKKNIQRYSLDLLHWL